jgi:coenzyme Q-binding protein COQ10
MPSFNTSRIVRHTAAQMFDLVGDVGSYPEFLPLCMGTRILKRTHESEGVETTVAEMRIGYRAIRETFTSRVRLNRSNLSIDVDYVDGPFRRMHNKWTFVDVSAEGEPNRCRVDFFIDYEFRSRAMAMVMGVMFDTAFRRFAQSFEERADAIYSPAGGRSGAPAT